MTGSAAAHPAHPPEDDEQPAPDMPDMPEIIDRHAESAPATLESPAFNRTIVVLVALALCSGALAWFFSM